MNLMNKRNSKLLEGNVRDKGKISSGCVEGRTVRAEKLGLRYA
jgi:hypothetical protein